MKTPATPEAIDVAWDQYCDARRAKEAAGRALEAVTEIANQAWSRYVDIKGKP